MKTSDPPSGEQAEEASWSLKATNSDCLLRSVHCYYPGHAGPVAVLGLREKVIKRRLNGPHFVVAATDSGNALKVATATAALGVGTRGAHHWTRATGNWTSAAASGLPRCWPAGSGRRLCSVGRVRVATGAGAACQVPWARGDFQYRARPQGHQQDSPVQVLQVGGRQHWVGGWSQVGVAEGSQRGRIERFAETGKAQERIRRQDGRHGGR